MIETKFFWLLSSANTLTFGRGKCIVVENKKKNRVMNDKYLWNLVYFIWVFSVEEVKQKDFLTF